MMMMMTSELKKHSVKHEGDGDTNCSRYIRNSPKCLERRVQEL